MQVSIKKVYYCFSSAALNRFVGHFQNFQRCAIQQISWDLKDGQVRIFQAHCFCHLFIIYEREKKLKLQIPL